MKNDQYFKHDVSASSNRKLIILLLQEGARGYGVYWILLEMLRKHADFRLPLNFLGAVAGMCHTHRKVVERVVREYDLFRVEGDYFYSPGMNKRMGRFVAKIFKSSPNATPNSEDNCPKKSELPLLSARIEEQSREEQSREENSRAENSSKESETTAAAVAEVEADIPKVEVAIPKVEAATPKVEVAIPKVESATLHPIRPWEALVGEMAADRSWMDMVGTHSGLGQLYIDHRVEIVDLFRQHIHLYDKGGGLLRLQDVRQYFANYLAAGSRTCQAVRQRLLNMLRQRQADTGVSPYETIVDGRRTYLGRIIPDSAPPRPDEFSVWDEDKEKWTR